MGGGEGGEMSWVGVRSTFRSCARVLSTAPLFFAELHPLPFLFHNSSQMAGEAYS